MHRAVRRGQPGRIAVESDVRARRRESSIGRRRSDGNESESRSVADGCAEGGVAAAAAAAAPTTASLHEMMWGDWTLPAI
jgi:hypothetical protein